MDLGERARAVGVRRPVRRPQGVDLVNEGCSGSRRSSTNARTAVSAVAVAMLRGLHPRRGRSPGAGDVEREPVRADRRRAEAFLVDEWPAVDPGRRTLSELDGVPDHQVQLLGMRPSRASRTAPPTTYTRSSPATALRRRSLARGPRAAGPSPESSIKGAGYPASPMTARAVAPGRRRGFHAARRRGCRVCLHATARGRLQPRRRLRRRADGDADPDGDPGGADPWVQEGRPAANFIWGEYGLHPRPPSLPARLDAAAAAVPARLSYTGRILLEFLPVMAEGKLFLPRITAALHDRQAQRQGRLGAQLRRAGRRPLRPTATGGVRDDWCSPENTKAGAVLRPLDAEDGQESLGSGCCPVVESPHHLFDGDRVYFGSENGTIYNLRAGDGAVALDRPSAGGAVKGGLALANGKLFFGDYRGPRPRDPPGRRQAGAGRSGDQRAARFGLAAAAVLFDARRGATGGCTSGTDGRAGILVLVLQASGKLAWTKGTGSYVYSSPAARPASQAVRPSVFFGAYNGVLLRRRRAQRQPLAATAKAARSAARRPSSATSSTTPTCGKKTTTGLGARTGQRGLLDGPRRLQPGHQRRPDDLPDRLLVALRPQAAEEEIGRVAKAAHAGRTADLRVRQPA